MSEQEQARNEVLIGRPDKNVKICIEDYVKSYIIKNFSYKGKQVEILFGSYRCLKNSVVVNISGAAALPKARFYNKRNYNISKEIEKIGLRFYPNLEPVGWTYSGVDGRINYSEMMDLHEKLFGETVGLVVTPSNEADKLKLYSYTGDGFRLLSGYILYYDKNSDMQEYILSGAHKLIKRKESIREIVNYLSRADGEKMQTAGALVVMMILLLLAIYEVFSLKAYYHVLIVDWFVRERL